MILARKNSIQDTAGQVVTSPVIGYVVGEEYPAEYRVLWADSWNASFLNAAQTNEILNQCRTSNINTVTIQVRKIGDAAYVSNIEPRATNIPYVEGEPLYDPLGDIIAKAHDTSGGKKKVHVHAWFVMHRISRGRPQRLRLGQ